jgi:hypothetical protein
MNKAEYLILSYFDLETPNEITRKELQEFKSEHPEDTATYNLMINYVSTINKFINWNYLKPPEGVSVRDLEFVRHKKCLLTDKGKTAKNQYETRNTR